MPRAIIHTPFRMNVSEHIIHPSTEAIPHGTWSECFTHWPFLHISRQPTVAVRPRWKFVSLSLLFPPPRIFLRHGITRGYSIWTQNATAVPTEKQTDADGNHTSNISSRDFWKSFSPPPITFESNGGKKQKKVPPPTQHPLVYLLSRYSTGWRASSSRARLQHLNIGPVGRPPFTLDALRSWESIDSRHQPHQAPFTSFAFVFPPLHTHTFHLHFFFLDTLFLYTILIPVFLHII
ncbi:hypothetical protein BC939DRAFT_303312 [Gamsiella multidivaricata]|uniref:uncharacterized protein n=1 Tax=Gamsiella multidivaricata TaxID=101098 RepID=UPI002220515C|nr:uncharacterized protein BC939DRAFT_303312 [Gamsiella multidivaricata]KAI7830229.1 hypothetical protein BC939DRAFT_303312 [Gamsiella multidivaricata]